MGLNSDPMNLRLPSTGNSELGEDFIGQVDWRFWQASGGSEVEIGGVDVVAAVPYSCDVNLMLARG